MPTLRLAQFELNIRRVINRSRHKVQRKRLNQFQGVSGLNKRRGFVSSACITENQYYDSIIDSPFSIYYWRSSHRLLNRYVIQHICRPPLIYDELESWLSWWYSRYIISGVQAPLFQNPLFTNLSGHMQPVGRLLVAGRPLVERGFCGCWWPLLCYWWLNSSVYT